MKLSTVQILVAHGADQNLANNRGETPLTIAEYLPIDQQQIFINALIGITSRNYFCIFINSCFLRNTADHTIEVANISNKHWYV